jgi:hypothetical protein
MTKEAILTKYGAVILRFNLYYKYSFTYKGEIDGEKITASFGGSGEDIYREDFEPTLTIKDKDYLLSYLVIEKDGKVIYEDNPNPSEY